MIQFDQVGLKYSNGFEGLSQLSFEVAAGEMAFITGHSGAGKSSLIKLLAVTERPTHGRVCVAGTHLHNAKARAICRHRQRLGLVFQDYRLLHDRSVFDNVALPLVIEGHARVDIARRVRAALNQVGLQEREHVLPHTLSGGEQQRVGIARAVVHRPQLIVADEPTGNLDPQLAGEIMQLFVSLSQAGTTVLVASHDLHLIQRIKKRVLVLDKGRLIDDFRPGAAA